MERLTIETVQMYAMQTPVKYIRGWKRASFIEVLIKVQLASIFHLLDSSSFALNYVAFC